MGSRLGHRNVMSLQLLLLAILVLSIVQRCGGGVWFDQTPPSQLSTFGLLVFSIQELSVLVLFQGVAEVFGSTRRKEASRRSRMFSSSSLGLAWLGHHTQYKNEK